MRLIIFIISLLFTVGVYAQKTDTIFNGYLSPIVRSGGTAPNFNFRAIFRNKTLSSNGFDTTGVSLEIMTSSDGNCYRLPVTSISTISNPVINNTTIEGTVTDVSSELATIPSGIAAIYTRTDSLGLIPDIEGLTEDLKTCIFNYNIKRIESVQAGTAVSNSFVRNDSVFITTPDGDFFTGINSGVDSSFVRNDSVFIASAGNELFSGVATGSGTDFDSNRPILRVPTAGVNIGGSTVSDWLNWWYFTPPTLSLGQSPSTTTVEIGTSNNYTFTTSINNAGGATLSNGNFFTPTTSDTLLSFTSNDSRAIVFTPLQTPVDTFTSNVYQFRSSIAWSFGSDSGIATSNTRTIQAVYPVLYGMVADTATAFSNPYGTLAKLVQGESNKTVTFNGSGLIIYGIPQTWSDTNLSSIIDPNGFNVTPSFTRVDYPVVTSTGLANNYTAVPYVFYFLNTGVTTTSNSSYTFNR